MYSKAEGIADPGPRLSFFYTYNFSRKFLFLSVLLEGAFGEVCRQSGENEDHPVACEDRANQSQTRRGVHSASISA